MAELAVAVLADGAALLGAEIGGEIGAFLIMNSVEVATVAAVTASVYTVREQQRRAQQSARNAYNASLRDRYVMARGATEPRQLVLGRQRVSGPLAYIGSFGSKRERLVMAVMLAAHEIDAIEAIYFDDELVTLDGSGNVLNIARREVFTLSGAGATFTLQSDPGSGVTAVVDYGTTRVTLGVSVAGRAVTVSGGTPGRTGTVTISYQPATSPYLIQADTAVVELIALDASGNGTLTLAQTPIGPITVAVTDSEGGATDLTAYASLAGNVVTVTGSPVVSLNAGVNYQVRSGATSRARIRQYLGAPGQAADAGMISALPGVWTSAHTLSGIAYLVVELDYDPDAFGSGVPNVSALVRGAKVYDPRTRVTAWSENPALLMRHAALSPLCGRMTSDLVNDAAVITAANACDSSVTYQVNGQPYTRPMYTAGLVVKSGTRPQDVLSDLAQAMAGKWAMIDGQLRVRAGVWTTPLQTLDELWLSGASPVRIQPRPNRADVINVATGTYADAARDHQVIAYPRVEAAAYIDEDGAELPQEIQLNAVTFVGQAQQVVAATLRDARQGLRVVISCNLRAYTVEPFDVINVSLARFGWVNKPFEVLDAAFTLDGGIQLTLKETDPSIWALGTTFADVDPAPNTLFPSPVTVPAITGLTADSSNAVQQRMADGTVLQRVKVSWAAISDQYVNGSGGGVEVRYGVAGQPEASWVSTQEAGTQTSTYLTGLRQGAVVLIKARAFNSICRGRWSTVVRHTVGTRGLIVDTPQIADQAATTVLETSLAGPDDWSSTNTNHVLATVTITNTDSVARQALIHAGVTWTFPNGIANGNQIWAWWMRTTDPNLGSTAAPDYTHVVAAGEDRRWTAAGTKTETIAAGATVIYWLLAKESFFTAPVRYYNEYLRVELIKR